MMQRLHLTTALAFVATLLVVAPALAGGSNKVNVCHIPPGNPANFHTITISENALPAHQAHGDLAGTCEENCDTLCDDGNPCTQDVDPSASECTCLVDGPPVDCNDSNLCTADSCDPAAGGCINAPIDCSDGDLCTVDSCDPLSGNCSNPPIACGAGESCDQTTGTCVDPCAGVICEPSDQCHVAGTCTDGVCDDPVAPNGTACNDGDPSTDNDVCTDGMCAGTSGGFDGCPENPGEEPCTPENIANGQFYHPHTDETRFLQCDQFGGCSVQDCPPGLVWDQEALTCNRP